MRREEDGAFVVAFEGSPCVPFRARGVPSYVLALAEEYMRGTS
jgi:hypothetical protein